MRLFHFHIKNFIIMLITSLSMNSVASAGFMVEQWTGFWSSDLSTLQTYAAINTPNASGNFSIINFTDDPRGFIGDLGVGVPWPAAAASGVNGKGGINNHFFARISGDFDITSADDYTFRTFNDDGIFLFIDNELIINDPTLHHEQRFFGVSNLDIGTHSLELYFFEHVGEASLELSIARGNIRDNSLFQLISNTATGPASISEPATIHIVLLGLIGFLGVRLYMQKKQLFQVYIPQTF